MRFEKQQPRVKRNNYRKALAYTLVRAQTVNVCKSHLQQEQINMRNITTINSIRLSRQTARVREPSQR